MTLSADELKEQAEGRCAALTASADLFDTISAFMVETAKGTWAEYEAAECEKTKAPLRMKHVQAMRVRDDYAASARENRGDVKMIEALIQASELNAELVGALEDLTSWFDGGKTHGLWMIPAHADDAIEQARVVLAKAKGSAE